MSRALVLVALVAAALSARPATAAAEPVTLRLASVAPEGTAFARELRAFGREVQAATHDTVTVKWYCRASPATS